MWKKYGPESQIQSAKSDNSADFIKMEEINFHSFIHCTDQWINKLPWILILIYNNATLKFRPDILLSSNQIQINDNVIM